MASGLITKRAVDSLPSAATPNFLWDTEVRGFGLKVSPSGSRMYVYQYRLGGRGSKVQRYTIGPHGVWTPDTARREAKRLAQLVDSNLDPSQAKATIRAETRDLAFSAYAERFITEYLEAHWKGGHAMAAGILRRDVIPVLKQKSLKQLGRADIMQVMDKLAGKPANRRNAFAILRRMFRWAINRGDLDTSPISNMDPPPAPASRDRVLSDAELAKVWLASQRLGYPFGPMIHLLVLTGQRREEVSGLDWSELDRQQAIWVLPSNRAKNGVVHEVPLSDQAIAVLDAVAGRLVPQSEKARWPNAGFVFTKTLVRPVSGYSKAKERLDELITKIELRDDEAVDDAAPKTFPAWRFHDLRRTLATGLQRLGIRFEVTEAVLNHVSGSKSGIAAVYQRYNWKDEKRAALHAWAKHVTDISIRAAQHM